MTAPADFLSLAQRAIAEATKGPWHYGPSRNCPGQFFIGQPAHCVTLAHVHNFPDDQREANAQIIVLAVNSFPALLDVCEAAKKLISAEVEYEESDDDKNDRELHARTLEARAHLRSRLARLEMIGEEVKP